MDCGRETERASAERIDGWRDRRRSHGVREEHPRGAQAPCEDEKRVRAAHYARDASRSFPREEARGRRENAHRDETRRNIHRGRNQEREERRKIAEKRGRESVRARW